MRWIRRSALGLLLLTGAHACDGGAQSPAAVRPADLIIYGRVWTGDSAKPWAEGVAVVADRVVQVGDSASIAKRAGTGTRVISNGKALVTPGFMDGHLHFTDGGFQLASVDLRPANSPQEFVTRLKDYALERKPGEWILGGDWDHERWPGAPLPTRQWIDSVTPNNPVFVNRLDGHMALANSAALRAAGVADSVADVAGGEIVRDAGRKPTGLLKDNAMELVGAKVPPPPDALNDRALDAAMKHVAAQGVTAVHHMGNWDELGVFERAWRAGRLSTRIYAAVPLSTWARLKDTVAAKRFGTDGRGDAWLQVGALKGFVDGSLGSHTAAFHEPFTDSPKDRGLFVTTPEDLYTWTSGADKAGLHVVIHAIGDRANATLLDIYERVGKENGARDRRFRIEHAQHLAPADIPRFGALGVIASMQPYHAIDDGRWAEKIIGPERIKGTYAFRALLDAGARLAFGSDWYVAPPTPL
jgi:predicted amidohydrolase YtcJ